ncbi:MAG: hypothetical protein S0880_36035 [Actinomycetota bacterium]|nr:hypothetical protein [Actinomycetota bacterium]
MTTVLLAGFIAATATLAAMVMTLTRRLRFTSLHAEAITAERERLRKRVVELDESARRRERHIGRLEKQVRDLRSMLEVES